LDQSGNPALRCWRHIRFLVPGLAVFAGMFGWALTIDATVPGGVIGIPSFFAALGCLAGIAIALVEEDRFVSPRVLLDRGRWVRLRLRLDIIPVPGQVQEAFTSRAMSLGLPLDGTSWAAYPRSPQAVLCDGYDLILEVLDLMEPLAPGKPLEAANRMQIERRFHVVGRQIANTEYDATEYARELLARERAAYNEGVQRLLKSRPQLP
jgi:hypothetical protein